MNRLAILSLFCLLVLAACQPVAAPGHRGTRGRDGCANGRLHHLLRIASPTRSAPRQRSSARTPRSSTGLQRRAGQWSFRAGTNGWTCITDWPASPGNDPMCIDDMFSKWNDALGAGAPLTVDRPGVAYMLAGGSDPSNTDPFAMEPAAGEEWISTPPHIMLLAPGGFDPYEIILFQTVVAHCSIGYEQW